MEMACSALHMLSTRSLRGLPGSCLRNVHGSGGQIRARETDVRVVAIWLQAKVTGVAETLLGECAVMNEEHFVQSTPDSPPQTRRLPSPLDDHELQQGPHPASPCIPSP